MLELDAAAMEKAWERVRENEGCAGVDGVTIEAYERQAKAGLPELLQQAQQGIYRALPLRKLLVEKKPGSKAPRTLLIPAVRDRILQTAMARCLSRSFEEEFLEVSYAYRPDRGVDRAVARILQLRDRGYVHILDADITAYFDSVSHARLLKMLEADPQVDRDTFAILRQWVKAQVWDGKEVKPLRRGIAQGSPVSPVLANFFLMPLDEELGKGDAHLVRYADDLLVLCLGRAGAEEALKRTQAILAASGLQLNATKTRITSFEEGFRFLGVQFRGAEAMIPWKAKGRVGRLLFLAHPMPARMLKAYRAAASEKPKEKPARREPARRYPPRTKSGETEAWDMAFLYITQQGSVLRKSGDRFLAEWDGQIQLDIPYHRLDHILVFGNVQVTSQAMAEALDHGIRLSLFTRHGRFRGALTPPSGRHVELRMAQYEMHRDLSRCIGYARAALRRKIENALAVLRRYEDRERETDQTADCRRAMEQSMEALASATTLAELEGHEGIAAKSHFEGLMRFNRSGFGWEGRRKHPATDPLNALLSLTYTLMMNELMALAEGFGLDPALGFLHEIDGNRPSLALDLMEPFRAPLADRFVLASVNRQEFAPDDFDKRDDHGGVVLKPAAMRRFFEKYEMWMLTPAGGREGAGASQESGTRQAFRAYLRREVERFAGALRNKSDWEPFAFAESEQDRSA